MVAAAAKIRLMKFKLL